MRASGLKRVGRKMTRTRRMIGNPLRGAVGWSRDGMRQLSGLVGATMLSFGVPRRTVRAVSGRGAGRTTDLRVERSITVQKPAAELDQFWRDPARIARAVADFAEVSATTDNRTHWKLRTPVRAPEWEAELASSSPHDGIAWTATGPAPIARVTVRFQPAPGDRGTVVTLSAELRGSPGSDAGALATLVRPLPKVALHRALRRFKSLVETGEIPTSAQDPAARKARTSAQAVLSH